MKGALLAFFGVVTLLSEVSSFSVSVPPLKTVCKTMVPGHDKYRPQDAASPFNVTTDIRSVKGGDIVEVTLLAKGERKFKGFYIQARDSSGNPIGTFNPNTNAKTHSCGGIRANAIHHVSPDEKSKITVSWVSPSNYKGNVQIQATMVHGYTMFWTPLKADLVKVV